MTTQVTFKKVRVSDKGQISLPVEIQRETGIKKGDELLLIRKGEKIILEKTQRISALLENEFADLEDISEFSLKQLWMNKKDDVWNSYLKMKEK